MKFVWGVTFKLLKYLYTLQIDCNHMRMDHSQKATPPRALGKVETSLGALNKWVQ
jgi:hypothetical protein